LCIFSEERAKQNAANNKKGTVGNKGKITPRIAKIRVINPKINQITLIIKGKPIFKLINLLLMYLK
tara:strand:- start:3862 stop:4059 length:198 start_codon:yes stop_codon:yes gene_type:complete